MKTNFYFDAFNFYYGSLKGTPYKWLNIVEFCKQTLPPPRNEFHRVRVCLARVIARPEDPTQPDRQNTYIRAMRTLPELSIHEGQFLEKPRMARLVTPLADGTKFVRVFKTEEKGSDVNLATYLLLDAFENDFDVAAVVTNDSDLAEPIRIVKRRFGKKVIVIAPCCNNKRKISYSLKKAASRYQLVDRTILARCQFPTTLNEPTGMITKPSTW